MDPALEYPNVTLLTGALVTKLATSPTGREVTSVRVERGGEVMHFSANVVVVSSGAINSAALLLRSASGKHPPHFESGTAGEFPQEGAKGGKIG